MKPFFQKMNLFYNISSGSDDCTTSVHHDQFVCEECDIDLIVVLKTPKSHDLINKNGTRSDKKRLFYCGRQLQWEKIPEFIVNIFVPAAYPASPSKSNSIGSKVSSYLNKSHDMLAKEPCPFKKLEYLNFIPPQNTPAVELHESVKAYLLKKCPEAVVDAMYRSSTVIGVACKSTKFAVIGACSYNRIGNWESIMSSSGSI